MDIDPFTTSSEILPRCNSSVAFLWPAEEEEYRRNRKYLKKYKAGLYINYPIDYAINTYGYRCDHVIPPDSDYILSAGCSHTFGQALHKEHRYSDLLEEHYNMPVLNIGRCGGSQNLIKDNLLQLLSSGHRLPKMMTIQWPAEHRLVVGSININVNSDMLKHKIGRKIFDDNSLSYYSKLAHDQTNWLLQTFNIPSVQFRTYDKTSPTKLHIANARDLDHPGIESNKLIFEYLKKEIDNYKI